jgi:hypothetical protein
MRIVLCAFLVAFLLMTSSQCVHWGASVGTNTSSWHIYRQSETMAFDISSSIKGEISPVMYHGNIISPYCSNYLEITANDVGIRERTSAYSGSIYAENSVKLQSNAENDINVSINKESDIAFIEHNERWPVLLASNGRLEYIGREINSLRSQRNNGDYITENFRYGPELTKQWSSISLLERMNATIEATNDDIILADFMPTRYSGYRLDAHTTGLADLGYVQIGPHYDFKDRRYPILAKGEERYFGTYNISMMFGIRSLFYKYNDTYNESDSWIPCCAPDFIEKPYQESKDRFY